MPYEIIQVIFLFLFITIFSIKLIISKIKNTKTIQLHDKRKSLKQFLFEITPLLSFTLIILLVLNNNFEWWSNNPKVYYFDFNYLIKNLAVLTGGLSFVFLILGYYQLGPNWKIGSGQETKNLVVSGIFSITRNPVYIFFAIFSFSLFFINGSAILFLLSVILTISLHKVALQEEKNLEESFKEEYLEYKKRVPRYFF